MTQMNLFIRQKQTHIENKLWLPKGKGGGGVNWELGISRYKLLYIKIDKQQGPYCIALGSIFNIL